MSQENVEVIRRASEAFNAGEPDFSICHPALVYRQSGRPVGTVGHVQQREALVVVWADGRIMQQMAYLDFDEARAAAERLAESRW